MSELPSSRNLILSNPPKDIRDKSVWKYLSSLIGEIETKLVGLFDNDNVVRDAADAAQTTADIKADYEEGDWTAGFTAGTSGTITIDNAYKTGAYVKIGKMVTVTGFFYVASVSSPVGILNLTGLPFVCGNALKYRSAVSVTGEDLEVTAITSIEGVIQLGTSQITLRKYAAGVYADLAADVKATSAFYISATYFTD